MARIPSPRQSTRARYEGAYERWTRHAQEFDGFQLALEVWATLKSWAFRRAFVERTAEIYRLSRSEAEALLRKQWAEAAEGIEFHAVVQAHDWRSTDLAEADSPWRVRLVDSSGPGYEPVSVRAIEDRALDEFFPKRTVWSRSYVIRFARPPHDGGARPAGRRALRLLFLSPRARAELAWDLPPRGDPAV